MKQNNKNHKKNRRNKHEYHQSSRTENHQKIKHYQNTSHEIMKYHLKKKSCQKNCQYINCCQKSYKSYKIILTVICEENIYDILLIKQNIQSFLCSRKMTNNNCV